MTLCGVVLFFQTQQSRVQQSMVGAQKVTEQNQLLSKKNEEIEAAKLQLEKDEKE